MRLEALVNNLPTPLAFNSDLFELDVLKRNFADRYHSGDVEKTPEKKIKNALKRVGASPLKTDQQVRLRDGKRHRMWALRNAKRWLKASTGELQRYLDPFLKKSKKEKPARQKRWRGGNQEKERPYENKQPKW
jgi:hypothetical protein